ncbi:MAG: hypothetical protein OEV86_15155 [Candidatus Krumholzibacteria bacterium]|nr:hypothetical protein [Candidatus Krumholzibacteria bacterium]
MSERHEGPVPPDYPLSAEGWDDDYHPVPVCPRCGGMMRRRRQYIEGVIVARLACDLHDYVVPRWVTLGDDAA